DDVQVVCLEQRTKPRSHQAIVVDDQYANPLRQESLRVSRDYPEWSRRFTRRAPEMSAYRVGLAVSSVASQPHSRTLMRRRYTDSGIHSRSTEVGRRKAP